ncbi:MAG: polyphosphate kinase 1 [Candidatus Cyclobacteriaceae bacterium M2_1C_046]
MSIDLTVEEQKYIDRDLSWLSFNERVLMEAADPNVPLYERIRFLGIYSSNLDEYFRVRVAALRSVVDIDKKKINKQFETAPKTLLKKILTTVNRQQQEFGRIKKEEILPELKKNGITLYRNQAIKKAHKDYLEHYFKSKILSYLQPVIISGDMAAPPFLENRALYLITELERRNDCDKCYGKVKVPTDHIERFIELPEINDQYYFIAIEDVIKENLDFIFSGYTIKRSYSIKLNRDADLNIEDEFSGNLVKKIQKQIKKRNLGVPSRFLYDSRMPADMLSFLQETYELSNEDLVPGGIYHNMHDLMDLKNPVAPKLEYEPQPTLNCNYLDNYSSIFEGINKKDVLVHFPYQTYDYVLRFFNEAALDPNTTHIYATFYRIAEESFISNALISAAKNGKKVTVFVEIKARFDEANNLKWAERMKEAGVNIIYSIPGLKVHAKVALIQRREKDKKALYGFYGTGNFNEKTATTYADIALFTSDKKMNKELLKLFKYLNNPKKEENIDFKDLFVAQFNLQEFFINLIDREIKNAKAGKDAHIILKLNNIQDEVMIDKLYEASNAGVKVDLIIRAICCLRPGIPGLSENINATRIVDRYLEHTRIFYFYNDGKEEFYSGSADWMKRNLYRRIEVVYPLKDKALQEEIRKFLQIQLNDNVKATVLDKNLRNINTDEGKDKIRSQIDFYKYLKEKEKAQNH